MLVEDNVSKVRNVGTKGTNKDIEKSGGVGVIFQTNLEKSCKLIGISWVLKIKAGFRTLKTKSLRIRSLGCQTLARYS